MSAFPFIDISGDYYDIGFQIGSRFKKQFKRALSFNFKALENSSNDLDFFLNLSKKDLVFSKKYFPNLVKEINGMADGSGIDFDSLWLLNDEDVLLDSVTKCTSIVSRRENNTFLYHNEDFYSDFSDNMYVFRVNLNNDVKILGLNYAGLILGSSTSVNSFGLTQCINSVYHSSFGRGIPKNIISRAVMGCSSIGSAVKVIKNKYSGSGYNHVLVKDNVLVDVESTGKKFKVFYVKDDLYVHTNHYLFKPFDAGAEKIPSSVARYNNALSMLKPGPVNHESIINILSSHEDIGTLCRHKSKKSKESTIASIIVDSKNLRLYLSKGYRCKSSVYDEYSL
ncbi:MAG: C45 family peptidase [Nanoarchaeota archaeon]